MGGKIKFIAPGIDATISSATLTGMSKEDGSGQMNSFTVVPTMTESEITALDGYKSWSGLKLLFTDESEGVATISFNVTNNSSKNTTANTKQQFILHRVDNKYPGWHI